MITPSKFTSLDKSVLGKLCHLIMEDVDEISLLELLHIKQRKYADIGEFILALDTLYVLGKIEMNDKGVIRYVS